MDTINLVFDINAGIDKVWHTLVNEMDIWWRKDFYTSPKTKAFIFEPKIGGRMYEDFGNNEGMQWAQVVGISSNSSIDMVAHLLPRFGGPAISFISIILSSSGDITKFEFTDCCLSDRSNNQKSQIAAGWKMIYEEAFKNYVESDHHDQE